MDNLLKLIIENHLWVMIVAMETLTIILIFIIGIKAMELKRKYETEKGYCDLITKRNEELRKIILESADQYNDLDKIVAKKEGEIYKLQKDYDSLLHIHNGQVKYLQQQLIDSKHTAKIIAIDYAYKFVRRNQNGYKTKDVQEMIEMISGFLKK